MPIAEEEGSGRVIGVEEHGTHGKEERGDQDETDEEKRREAAAE